MHEDVMGRIRQWLQKKNEDAENIDDEEDLIDARIIDSLSFVEFIIFIEEVTGRDGLMETISVDSFRSLGSIERSLLATS